MALTLELGTSTAIFVAVLVLGIWCPQAECRRLAQYENPLRKAHEEWMIAHGRTYKDDAEKEMRFKIFSENAVYVEKFNNQLNLTFKLRTNVFADLTNEEFLRAHTGGVPKRTNSSSSSLYESSFVNESSVALPSSIDWRQKGVVTPVKIQGKCGELH